MPYFNFYLDADLEIDKDQLHTASEEVSETILEDDGSYQHYLYDSLYKIRTRKQLKALKLILCNLVQFENKKILYSRRHTETLPQRYNPQQIGTKVIKTVVDELEESGYLKNKTGDNSYKQKEDNSPALKSEIISTDGVILLAEKLGVVAKSIYKNNPSHLFFRETKTYGGKFIDFEETEYTQHIEKLMSEYCAFLNQHTIINLKTGEQYEDIHLIRTYRNRKNKFPLLYGGRSGGYWHQERDITIDGKATVELDYNASLINNLHKFLFNSYLNTGREEDLYHIEGVDRKLVKILITRCMINSESRSESSARFTFFCDKDEYKDLKKESKLTTSELVDAVEEKFAVLKDYFYRGKDRAEHYAWIDQNHLFFIAHQASLNGICALTVHDSFIVKESDKDTMEMLMYSTAMPEIYKRLSPLIK